MDGGAWKASVHGVTEGCWTRLRDFIFTFHFHALEKEMATHSVDWVLRGFSCLENPRDGEPGWGLTESDTTEVT